MQPEPTDCSDCTLFDRRGFVRAAGLGVATLATGAVPRLSAVEVGPMPREYVAGPAEKLVKELFAGFTAVQKKTLQLPWESPLRVGMFNAPIQGKKLVDHYTKPQQALVEKIVRAMVSGDEGFHQISRAGTWDNSKSFDQCGALIFGDPSDGKKFAFVFSGHHLTIRCDGDSEEGAAFGGPIYYGHTPYGYSDKNVFNYQTKSVMSVFDALDGKQREKAVVQKGSPGEQAASVRFRPKGQARPGIAYADLSKDQQALVESVMRTVCSPYRKEDVDEVMTIIKATGGMEKIHLAFYKEGEEEATDRQPWNFWRLEGPGFVWNYRVLPHVHTFVNISQKIG